MKAQGLRQLFVTFNFISMNGWAVRYQIWSTAWLPIDLENDPSIDYTEHYGKIMASFRFARYLNCRKRGYVDVVTSSTGSTAVCLSLERTRLNKGSIFASARGQTRSRWCHCRPGGIVTHISRSDVTIIEHDAKLFWPTKIQRKMQPSQILGFDVNLFKIENTNQKKRKDKLLQPLSSGDFLVWRKMLFVLSIPANQWW